MTTLNEFRQARDESGDEEPDLRTTFAHCRGFSAGAEWASSKLADSAESLQHAVDKGDVEPAEALEYMASYARGHQKLAASRRQAKTPAQNRRDIDTYLASFGGRRLRQGRHTAPLPGRPGMSIEVTCDVDGQTAFIMIDRLHGLALPNEGPELDWITEHVYPFTQAWLDSQTSTDAATPRPDAGMVASTKVRTVDALEVLRLWIPQELYWQDRAADDYLAELEALTPKETDR